MVVNAFFLQIPRAEKILVKASQKRKKLGEAAILHGERRRRRRRKTLVGGWKW